MPGLEVLKDVRLGTLRKALVILEVERACPQKSGMMPSTLSFDGSLKQFLESGGTEDEVEKLRQCLASVVPRVCGKVSDSLSNGSFSLSDPWCVQAKIDMVHEGFSPSDHGLLIDKAVDRWYFLKKQEAGN